MNNRIQNAFETIHASDELKSSTQSFLLSKMKKSSFFYSRYIRYAAAFAACLIFFLCTVGGSSIYRTPVSYISIDINPSIELSLNRFDRIVDAKGYNKDGTALLDNLDLENKYYTDGVEILLADGTFKQYLQKDSSLIFTVISKNEEKLLSGIKQCQGYKENQADCHGSSQNIMTQAHHSGMSFGKYEAYLELSQYDSSITPEQCNEMSMCEIRSLISQYSNDYNSNVYDSDNCNESGKNNSENNTHGHQNRGNHGYHE